MAQARTSTQVALLGTVVLLLDDEAEQIGTQLARLCLTLDPLVRARLRLLRVSQDARGQLLAHPFADEQRQLVPAETVMGATSAAYHTATVFQDPNVTQFAASLPNMAAADQPFEMALQEALQAALHVSGTEPLPEHGFALIPNEVGVHLVGRIDSPLLANVAGETQRITSHISAQTDARRFALLLAAAPINDPSQGQNSPKSAAWQEQAQKQPWQQLLSWEHGQPPLLYTFLFEAWDEDGRFHDRPQLYYSVAEALFALFATGMLEDRAFKEALDLSTAAMEGAQALTRVGSIGGSLITSPTQAMIDFLAYRLTADVLLQRGLLGEEGAIPAPDVRDALPHQVGQEADRWLTSIWRRRVFPDVYPLPRGLPAREMADGARGTWHPMALSTAGPAPQSLLWRWERGRLPLDEERFWDLETQNDFETSGDLDQWLTKADATYQAIQRDLQTEISQAVQAHVQAPEGVQRATVFVHDLQARLGMEYQRLQEDDREQQHQLELHYQAFEALVRRNHQANGIPARPNPPAYGGVPRMPRNLEALTHETLDSKFARVPLPATMIAVALVLAIFGAFAVDAVPHIPGFALWPTFWQALFAGMNRHFVGAGALLVLFVVASLGSFVRYLDLRRWQRRLMGERMLLQLAQTKSIERAHMRALINALLADLGTEQIHLQDWNQAIHQDANTLNQQAAVVGHDFATAPTLSRDIFLTHGVIWEGMQPDALYLQVRQSQSQEKLILDFLHYVQAHGGGVAQAINARRLRPLALSFMYEQLRMNINDDPFEGWSAQTAQVTLNRALQAARVAIQPIPAGRPLAHFTGIMIYRSVDWVAKVAQEEHAVLLPAPTPAWAFVVRVLARAQHPLVQAKGTR
jgi:hypothetical protein